MAGRQDDTIAAISTAPGEGGIGIVRISGTRALPIAAAIFRGKNKKPLAQSPSHTVHYGAVVTPGQRRGTRLRETAVDEVLLTVMRAPRTYTREDIVEISGHGGVVPLRRILALVLKQGARLAAPGEFTQRAFLNGRIDLAQAEAVLQIVQATSDAALDAAVSRLHGALSRRIERLRRGLIEMLAPWEALLDFPEEGVHPESRRKLGQALRAADKTIGALLEHADQGILLNQGIRVALAGRPNVGKSSLMNALLNYERVIVTDVSGTTRDIVEELIVLDGVPVRLADTAGIMDSGCAITRESVRRTVSFLGQADLVLLVLDATSPVSAQAVPEDALPTGKPVVVLVNKIDVRPFNQPAARQAFPGRPVIGVSALTGEGLPDVKKQIQRLFTRRIARAAVAPLIASVRQKNALESCRQSVRQALAALADGQSEECLVFEVREAVRRLGEITGESAGEDILDAVFSRFCIGK
ncbi:MAG: tRNA uridine-5-carboxymethylaminomethyl(34) synthesis GTPase MnmE [Candidatus Omnitrophica bacterium]|nr:tRNA uridine-5-carboxymethylaminomethyl(34) synthesis GTPase MnmE [Candidatus Omnitrophota bacterium]